jgi:uncharacterized membrane protein YjdF
MDKDRALNIILLFTGLYLAFFALYSLLQGNYEFLYYGIAVFIIFALLVKYRKTLQLSLSSFVGLSLAQLIHILGGNISIHGTRLYDLWIVEHIIRYDNFVHFVTTFILALVIYDMIKNYLHEKMHYNKLVLYLLIVLIVSGIGAFNEIIELGAVLFFNAGARVGDYFNNAFDLVFNFLGSSAGAAYILSRIDYRKRHKEYTSATKRVSS